MLARLLRLLRTGSRNRKPSAFGCGCTSLIMLLALGIAVAVLISRCVPTDSQPAKAGMSPSLSG